MKIPQTCTLTIGVLLGTLIGVLTDDIALWIPIGIALGAVYKYLLKTKQNETN